MIESVEFLGKGHPAHLPQSALKKIEEETGFSFQSLIAELVETGKESVMIQRVFDHSFTIAFHALKAGAVKEQRLLNMNLISSPVGEPPYLIDKFPTVEDFGEIVGYDDVLPIAMKMIQDSFKGIAPDIPSALPQEAEPAKKKR